MAAFTRTVGLALCALAFVEPLAYGQRMFVPLTEAWNSRSIVIVRGKLVPVSLPRLYPPSSDRTAYFDLQISEWLKPRSDGQPPRITVVEPHWGATDTAVLRPGAEVLLFLSTQGQYFHSMREIYLDSTDGPAVLQGVRRFLNIMYMADAVERQKACLSAWNDDLSDPEKRALLDAMWLNRNPDYSEALLRIARGKDSPRLREWALCILGYIGNDHGIETLVPLLSSEADCEVLRQLLFVFGMYRLPEAVTAIDEFLASSQPRQCPARQMEALRARAQEARNKITGIDTSKGWKN